MAQRRAGVSARHRWWVIGFASLFLVIASAGAASADLSQLGYGTVVSSQITGSQANLIANNGFGPDPGSCILQSVLLDAYTSANNLSGHVEAGYLRCNATQLDGVCNNGYRFVETWYGRYYCTQYAAFGLGKSNNFSIQRSGDSATAYINGSATSSGGTGFNQPQVAAVAWIEHTGGGGCAAWGPTSGNFGTWQRRVGSTWGVGGTLYQDYEYCLTASGMDGNGNFSIS